MSLNRIYTGIIHDSHADGKSAWVLDFNQNCYPDQKSSSRMGNTEKKWKTLRTPCLSGSIRSAYKMP